jgi:hypothetical protein
MTDYITSVKYINKIKKLYNTTVFITSRDSVVCIATGYGLDNRGVGVRVPVGPRIFSSPRQPDRLWGPLSAYSMGTGGSFPWDKAAETDHAPAGSAEVKKVWIYISTSPYAFMA